jgi:hypothetical protein
LNQNAQNTYQNLLQINQNILIEVKKKIRLLSFLRLIVFLTFTTLAILFWKNNTYFILSIFIGIASFLLTVNFWVNFNLAKEKIEQKIKLISAEIELIRTNISIFDAGKEFSNPKHAFSNDLDFFADRGIFSFLNKTSSFLGKHKLAEILLNGSENPSLINKEIEYFHDKTDWMFDFRVAGSISSREKAYSKLISNFSKISFKNPSWMKFLVILIPVISFSALTLDYFNLISSTFSGILLIACLVPTGFLVKETNLWASTISEYEPKVNSILDQLILLNEISDEKSDFSHIENEFKRWKTIAKRFDLRLNLVLSIPINLFFAWDFHQRLVLEKWTKSNSTKLAEWENKLATIEVYISGATTRFNSLNRSIYAEISKSSKDFICSKISHPLIIEKKCVTNDFILNESENFYILTGPNMAGKSTFLRSLGINIVFANAGFPVFSEAFQIPEITLFSSMRTADDLSNESSYFHAELTRLKQLKDCIKDEKQLFVLLDEILKGTNSKDKEEGSKKFLKKLKNLGAKGIIATHDISLCELCNEESAFTNFYFDSTINNDELSFDYTIKKGICQNMNASFLLKKMRLID